MTPLGDAELIQAAGQGDAAAFEALVRRHQRGIVQFAHTFLGTPDRNTAEDVAQEVFLAAWRAAPRFRAHAQVSTWLYRIAANACTDHRRRQRLRLVTSLDSRITPDHAISVTKNYAEETYATKSAEQVRAAIAALPDNQRLALILRHYQGLSYTEISDVLETSLSAVESLLFRARRSLTAALARQDSKPPPQVTPGTDV
jgi:RNA polymerase sigma-70 factor (ECF subfamily)